MKYDTKGLIYLTHKAITGNDYVNSKLKDLDFNVWIKTFREEEQEIKSFFPKDLIDFTFKDEFLKLVYKSMFNKLPFSIEYVYKTFSKESCIIFPSLNPKNIEIFYSGIENSLNNKLIELYWDESEKWDNDTIRIFIPNKNSCDEKKYKEIINKLQKEYKIDQDKIFVIGGDLDGLKSKQIKWDKGYVRAKYESKMLGRDFLYYPSKKPSRLIIFFSSMGHDRYDRYSWFWDESEKWDNDSAYLFLKDDDFNFFVGTDSKPLTQTYFKIIKHFMELNQIDKSNVFTTGGSMGGYASVYYAVSLGLKGCIVGNLQTTKAGVQKHKLENWRRQVKLTGDQFIDLPDLVDRHFDKKLPYLYIEYSAYPADKFAAEALIDAFKQYDSVVISNKNSGTEHNNIEYKKEHIEKAIALFETF